MTQIGLDVKELARRVRAGVGGPASTVDEALGPDVASGLATFRQSLVTTLLAGCVRRIRQITPDARITVHGDADAWATGSFCALGNPASLEGVDVVVANGWHDDGRLRHLSRLSALVHPRRALGTYLRLDQGWPGDDVRHELSRLAAVGVDELHLYHLGLWPDAQWRIARDIAAARHEELA